jgi:hypothetical protein
LDKDLQEVWEQAMEIHGRKALLQKGQACRGSSTVGVDWARENARKEIMDISHRASWITVILQKSTGYGDKNTRNTKIFLFIVAKNGR